ncbi:MAG TPA: PASTA domain-containing protein [Solirubrobacteraceae bacterium]|nr:PASTA domain-containing protein [Solirubrobacteraceae bacterium]
MAVRRRAGPVRLRIATAVAALAALAGATPAAGQDGRVRAVAYGVTGVGPSGRSVAIAFTYGGCEDDPRVTVHETATAVGIGVTVRDRGGPDVACPAIAVLARRTVRLSAPLEGRRILGWTARAGAMPPSAACPDGASALARVVQMAAGDARRLLRGRGLVARTSADAGEVTAQRPAAGTCVRAGSVVRLTVRAVGSR